MKVEDAINKLKDTVQQCHNSKCRAEKDCTDCYVEIEDIQAIETILLAYEEEKEKNKQIDFNKLEKGIHKISPTNSIGPLNAYDFRINYISKDKVKKVLINSANEDKHDFHSAYEKLFEDFEKILEED